MALDGDRARGTTGVSDERVRAQIDRWREELIDLSRRNRLLNFKANKSSAIEITAPEAGRIADGLSFAKGWRFHYPPQPDLEGDDAAMLALEAEDPDLTDEIRPDELLTTVAAATDLSRILHTIERRASQEYIDKGLRVLYLGLGVLEWEDADRQSLTSPLALMPVLLERANPREPFRLLSADEDAVLNPALAVKLDREFGIRLPEVAADDFVVDEYLDAVSTSLGDQAQRWNVSPRVVLSCFSFHKEVMYRDLLANEDAVSAHDIVRALALGPSAVEDFGFDQIPDEKLDEVAPPESMASILDADSTQRKCILAARDGRTFVMDGPPGTGKSQTIANVIAELLSAGKSVLFVSEKAAALEVVMSRLEDCGLGHFVLELHSHKATRKEVAGALYNALNERPRARSTMLASDIERVAQRRRELSAYAAAVNESRQPLGLSIFEAIGRHEALADLGVTPVPEGIEADLTIEAYNDTIDSARTVAAAWGPVARGDDFLWRDLADAETLNASEVSTLIEEARAVFSTVQRWTDAAAAQLGLAAPHTRREAEQFLSVLRHLSSTPAQVPAEWLSGGDDSPVAKRLDEIRAFATDVSELSSTLDGHSSRWREIAANDHEVLRHAERDLQQLVPSARLRADLAATELPSLSRYAREAPAQLESLISSAQELGRQLGTHLPADSTPSDLQRVFSLGALGAEPDRPLTEWFDPRVAADARRAASLILPLVSEYQTLAQQLADAFSENIMRFDVESLFGGEQDVRPNLSRFSADGRMNRKNLKACTRSGRITRDAVSMLPAARTCQRLRDQLDEVEPACAPLLAPYYSDRDQTNIDRLAAALAVAEQILNLSDAAADRHRLAGCLSIDADNAEEIGRRAHSLSRSLEAVLVDARNWFPGTGAAAEQSVSAFSGWLAAVGTAAVSLAGPLERAHQLCPSVKSVDDLTRIVEQRCRVASIEAALSERLDDDQLLLGGGYVGLGSSWEELATSLEWARTLRSLINQPLDTFTAQRLLECELVADELDVRLRSAGKSIAAIESLFTPERGAVIVDDLEVSFDAAEALLGDLASSLGDIDEWIAFVQGVERLQRGGFSAAVEACIQQRLRGEDVPRAIERSLLSAWIDANTRSDPRLKMIRAAERDRHVAEFQQLDRALRTDAAARVINTCSDRRPSTTAGAAGIIIKEGMKKKRHMPVRELLARSSAVAVACKPCFMMSPLTVSQFLPSDMHFDAVLFDEASQVRPSDAINAVYRGSQLIVAGDDKQLPPTSFFERLTQDESDEWDEEQLDEFESVL
jgi:hypothetical protein